MFDATRPGQKGETKYEIGNCHLEPGNTNGRRPVHPGRSSRRREEARHSVVPWMGWAEAASQFHLCPFFLQGRLRVLDVRLSWLVRERLTHHQSRKASAARRGGICHCARKAGTRD